MPDLALTATDLQKAFGGALLLDGAELHLQAGEKVGLIGRNGTGKTTLLRALAGREPLDGGLVVKPRGTKIALLEQDPDLTAHVTLLDVALRGAERASDAPDEAVAAARARKALHELGLLDPTVRVVEASGGMRRRAALAAALVEEPDLLLLDEPTNHLDAAAAEWLQGFLRKTRAAVLLVTHDRYFLNAAVDRIVELRRGRLTSYPGTYQDWLEARLEEDAVQGKLDAARRKAMARERDWLGRSPCARTCRPKARLTTALELLDTKFDRDTPLTLPTPTCERLPKTALDVQGLTVGYDVSRPMVQNLSSVIQRGERIGIAGASGAGKTTLLRTLLGQLPPLQGTVTAAPQLRVAYVDQARSGLDPRWTVAEAAVPGGGDWVATPTGKLHVAGYLAQFLFRSEDLRQPVGTLSGGQRLRLLLARLLQTPLNVLALDEPTNDLDFETLEVLEDLLLQLPDVCVLVVSHDRALLDRVATRMLWLDGDGAWDQHTGGCSALLANRAARREPPPPPAAVRRAPVTVALSPPKPTWHEEQRLSVMEAEIEAVERALAEKEDALAAGDASAATDHGKLSEQRDRLYAEWQTTEAKKAAWEAWRLQRPK
jgi:ATP-binding cassette subfamily F protein uup